MWALTLLAAEDPLNRPEIIWGAAGLVAALLAGAVAIWLAERWRKRAATNPAQDADTLATYREMYEQGELTDVEFAELRRKLADKAKPAPAVAAAPVADPTGRPNIAKFVPPEVLAKRQPPPVLSASDDATEIDRPAPPAALPEPPPPPESS